LQSAYTVCVEDSYRKQKPKICRHDHFELLSGEVFSAHGTTRPGYWVSLFKHQLGWAKKAEGYFAFWAVMQPAANWMTARVTRTSQGNRRFIHAWLKIVLEIYAERQKEQAAQRRDAEKWKRENQKSNRVWRAQSAQRSIWCGGHISRIQI